VASPIISLGSGQYHFITADGWKENWTTETAREWWQKQLWLKAGAHKQEKTQVKVRIYNGTSKVPSKDNSKGH